MPIFDNELIDNVRGEGSLKGPDPVLGSVEPTKLDMNGLRAGAMFSPVRNQQFGLDDLRKIKDVPSPKGFDQIFASAQKSELLANKRYPVYERGVDLENIYGLQQSWYDQLGNGVAKLGANIVGTFAQSLTNIPNTVSAIKEKDFAKLSGDPDGYEGTIDTWMRNMDDVFPNYMTQYERDHPFKTAIPFTRGSANWWGGKFLPNIGFMVGAVAGAAATDIAVGAVTEGIGEIPLVAAQLGKASLYLNKLFTSETQLNRVLSLGKQLGKTEQQLLNVRKLAELSAAAKVTSGFRYGTAVIGSAMTEAAVESRGAYNQVKDELTKQYIAENGIEPGFNAAQEIEEYATNAMNTRFGINMALLTTSNTLQFGSLFRSMTATRGITPQLDGIGKIGLAEGSLDTFERQTAKTIAGKVWESVKPGVSSVFREGVFEEGGQFAAERGTYDYYTRKYKSDKYKNNWNDVNEVIKSTTFGMKEQFGSQEGIENMLIGGLTGLLIGKVQNLYENKKGIGQDAKTGNALNILNRFGVTNTLQRMYDDTVTQAGIVQDMQDAVKSKDVFKYKNFQADAFFNFVQSRVPYGMHDVTIEQLNMLKDLPKDQFEQMFQLDFNQTNKSTVNEYVDGLITKANEIKKTSDAINQTFRNPFKNAPKEGDIESQIEADNYDTFENYKLDLAYYASIAPDINGRVSSIQQDINNIVPGLSTDVLSKLTDAEGLSSLSRMYEERANQLNSTITELTSVQDKINIKNQVKALRTRSEKIAMALGDNKMTDKLFEDLLNFEMNGQDATKENIVPLAQVQKLREYGFDINRLSERKKVAADAYDKLSTKEGFEKYFEQAEEMAADKDAIAKEEEKEEKPEEKVEEKKEPVYKNKAGVDEKLEKNREYQLPTAKTASVKKIADDRWEVSYPGGPTKFYKTQEDAKLAADDINDELGNLQKVKVLGFNDDGSVKVENLKGDIFNIQPSRLTGYERLETKEEKFSKAAGDINRQQTELEKKSGTVNVGQATEDIVPTSPTNETKLKAASEFFASSTGPSESREDITQVSPQVIRSRVFLNNAKNFKNRNKLRVILVTPNQLAGLGLNGMVDLSEIPNVNDVDLGLVAQVFVEEDGGKLYFVDEKGERISEVNGQPTDLSRVIFKAMPTTELYYNYTDQQGNRVPKYRQGEKEAFQAYANGWKQVRETLFKADPFPIKLYKFNISRGVAKTSKIDGKFVRSHVGGTILSEDKISTQEGLIIINEEGFITHQGKNIGWKKGVPAIQFADTLEHINNTKLSGNKAVSIYQVIKALAKDTLKQYEAGKGISLNEAYMTYLQNVLYLRRTGALKPNSNQFFIDTENMSISLGDKVYKLDEIDSNQSKMVEQLKSLYHNLNSFTLKDAFYSPFYEYVYENDTLKEVEWTNYQSYLLSAKTPDGKSRGTSETPFLTNVLPPTPAVPYSFEQKYSTLVDFDIPLVEMPKAQPSASGAPMIGEYDMGGEKVNTYPSQLGPIDFTATITEQDGKDVIDVIVKDNATVKKLSEDAEFVENTVIPGLQGIVKKDGKSEYDPSADDATLVKKWASYRVIGQLYNLKQQAPQAPAAPAPQAAVLQPNVTPLAQAQGTARTEPVITAVSTEAKSAVDSDIQNVLNAKNKEELTEAGLKLINIDPYSQAVSMDVRANLLTPGMFEKGKQLFLEEVKGAIEQRRKLEEAKPAEPILDLTPTIIRNLENELIDKSNRLQQMELNAELAGDSVNRYWYIADNLPKIKPESARKETGVKTGSGKDISSSFLNAKTGVSVERAAEMIVEQSEGENTGLQLTEDFVRNEIIDLLQLGKKEYKKKSGSVYKKDIEALRKEIDELSKQLESLQPPKLGGFNVNEALPDSGDYMRVGVNENEAPMTDAEYQAFKAWHAEKVPGIPFEVLDNVVTTHDNEKAFGVFENGVAKFHKLAPATTPYHEVGEGIWKAFLTPEQRQLILDDERARSGQFTDRASRKQIYYADATDQQLKERIWDDYAEFRAGKIKAKFLGQRVLAFFRNILEFFKQFVQKPSMKEQLFKAIESGKFKEFKVSEGVKRDNSPEYMRIPGLTETQAYYFVQDMVIRSGRILFGGSKKSIYKLNKLTGRQVFETIEQEYLRENKRQQMSDVTWNMLKKRTVESLRTIGVNYNEEDLVNINSEGTTGLGYAPEPFSVNWKKSAAFGIKFLAFIMPKTKPTNQQNSTSLKLPERVVSSSVLGSVMAGYGRIFSTLFSKLSNTTSPKLMGKKLSDLAKYDADFVRFFQYIGGDLQTGEVDFSQFKTSEDWRLFIQFFQTFSLQKPEAFAQYVTGAQVYTQPANQFTAAKEIEYGWYEGIKALSTNKDSIIKWNREKKSYEVDTTNVKKYPPKAPKLPNEQLEFLSNIGIEFDPKAYASLKTEGVEDFTDAVGNIHTYLKQTGEIGNINGKELGINSYISTLANLLIEATNPITDSTYPGVDGSRLQSYTQNNYFSVFENEFNEAETLEDLVELRPELQDVFSQNSVVLMKNGLFYKEDGTKKKKDEAIKVSYIQGERDNNTNTGTVTSDLSLGERMTQEINQNLNGNYYIMLPADSSTEWMINLGNHVTYNDIKTGRAWNRFYKVFNGYLIDDINVALDWKNRSKIKNVKSKAKELRFFKEILSKYDKEGNLVPSAILTEINKRIEDGQSIDQIKEYINREDVASQINEMVKISVEENVNRTREALGNTRELVEVLEENGEVVYSYKKLDNKFATNKNVLLNKFSLSNENVNDVLTFARMNYMIANTEFHKVFFGDPYQFKIKDNNLDETKRVKSFGSPRKVTFNTPEFNSWLNDEYNSIDGELLNSEEEGELGYHLHKDYANTITVADIEFASNLYPEVNEADADSWLMDTAYRELKLKNAQWPQEAEDWHQWQMAYTRQNLPGYQYKSDSIKKHDIELLKNPEPKFVIEKLKPVATGTKAETTSINLILDKFAQLPIYYKAVQGRNLEKLYVKMWKEKVDYAVMVSGRKLGAEELQKFYKDNNFNQDPFNNFVKVPWKALGIQVENSYENPKDQTWGSQPAKISSMDFFSNGEEAMPGAKKAYDAYINATKKYHENKYQQLLKKLGLEDLGNGFKLTDPKAVAETLEGEFFRQQLSENVKYAIQLDENNQFPIPFEASTHYKKIKDILYSMVNKALVSPKLNGGPKAMSSVTLWEKGQRDPNAPNPELKFYTENDPYIEILLPYKYKSKFNKRRFPTDESILKYLNTPEGKQIISGVAFRIPCDAQNKIDTYRIKGFLPEFMGDVVIVPSELTAKAGLDFDFDKMSTYLKSIYVDKSGDVRLVKYLGSEEATKEFFGKVFEDRLEKKKVSKAEILEALQILDLGLDDPNNLVERYSELLDLLLEDTTPEDRADALVAELEKLGDVNLQAALKEKYVDDMYNRSLENEYFQAMENMLILPDNFERRLTPTGDAGLKEVAGEINKLRGIRAENVRNRLLDGTYMTTLRNNFLTGKEWVGIVATNITSHSLFQKTQVTLDPYKVFALPFFEKNILAGGVVLPHNTIKVDGRDRLSLSGTKTADGSNQFISDRLAGYGTAVVDIAKDPFIMDIVYSDLLISTTIFLERIGSGKYVSKFINQPIIREYISYLESKGERGLFNTDNVDNVKQLFPTKDATVAVTGIDINNLDSNIENYAEGKLTPAQNAEQHNILDEFLKYSKMAQYSFTLTQAINYDTSKSRNSDSFSRKQTKTGIAQQKNIFCCAESILAASFIGNQRDLIDFAMSSMGEIIKTEQDEFRIITDSVLTPYEEVAYMKEENFEKIAGKLKASFIDYIIQTKTNLNNELTQLTLGNDSVAKQLEEAKKKYPQMRIFNDLQVVTSDREGGAQTIKTRVKITDPVDENIYTEMMRELRDTDPQLFNNIVKVALAQGVYESSISIKNIIPAESYSEMVKPVIDALASTPDIQAFSNGAFQKNNWNDDNVVPVARVTFYEDENVAPSEDQYGNEYYKYISKAFQPVEQLGVKSELDRRILTVSPMSSDAQYDFLKIRKITTLKNGDMIDISTGISTTSAAVYNRRKSGDLSVDEIYGYQKVKDGADNPVTDYKGRYIYKLVNLWGDGNRAVEYYPYSKRSIYNNGTVQIDNEIPDNDIISLYGGVLKAEANIVPSQPVEQARPSTGLSTPSGKLKLRDGKEYNISDINASLLESIGYKPSEIGKLLKSIC